VESGGRRLGAGSGLAVAVERDLKAFGRRYRAEMKRPESRHLLDILAALSRQTDLAVRCYCADEVRCHRSILRELLAEHGAELATRE
jgi:uncharacterized protein YeaO (DUF488 family)